MFPDIRGVGPWWGILASFNHSLITAYSLSDFYCYFPNVNMRANIVNYQYYNKGLIRFGWNYYYVWKDTHAWALEECVCNIWAVLCESFGGELCEIWQKLWVKGLRFAPTKADVMVNLSAIITSRTIYFIWYS